MIAAGLLLFAASTQPGQTDVSRNTGQQIDSRFAQSALETFADCALTTSSLRPYALRTLRTRPSDPRYLRDIKRIRSSECVPERVSSMGFGPDLLRLALFTGLYRREFGSRPLAVSENFKPLNVEAELDRGSGPVSPVFVMVRTMIDCAVRSDPKSVHELIVAETGSRKEADLWPAVTAKIIRCNTSNTEFRLKKSTMRGQLSEALYKLRTIYAPAAGAPSNA